MSNMTNPIVIKNSKKEWIISLLIFSVLVFFYLFYHDIRGKAYSLWTANKSMALSASIFISISILFGPLYRKWRNKHWLVKYRRTFGVIGGASLLFHVPVSLFFLPSKFPGSYFIKHAVSTIIGVLGFSILVMLLIISTKRFFMKLGHKKWKFLQRFSIAALMLCLAHFAALGKIPNWVRWFQNFDKPPPGTMIPFLIGSIVLLIWIIDFLKNSRKNSNTNDSN